MTTRGYTLFDTAVGRCGIAWTDEGVARVLLPDRNDAQTRRRLQAAFPDGDGARPPADVETAITAITRLLGGEDVDLSTIALDFTGVPDFHRRVYEAARAVPAGATVTYGEVAKQLGSPGSARAVGQALGRNPFAVVVPCHRVVAAGGKLGGFSATGGVATKSQLLAIEGAAAAPVPGLFDDTDPLPWDRAAAVAHLRQDPVMAGLVDQVGPLAIELKTTPSVFAALAEAIVYQQLHARAASTIYARVCALFPRPKRGPTPERLLSLPDEPLREAGLSRAKLASLRDLAQRTVAGELPTLGQARRMEDEELVERLSAVRGIGRWTAEMFLVFRLGRPDVLPVDDYGVRQGYALTFGGPLPKPRDLEAAAEPWRPYRTAASWYFWRAVELTRA